jgi:hypothetical protein
MCMLWKKTDGFVTDIIAFSDRKKYNNILEKDVEKLYTNANFYSNYLMM